MKKLVITVVVLFLVIIGLASSLYIVNEDEVAVVSTLGKVVGVVIDSKDLEAVQANLAEKNRSDINISPTKGLHFKIPFIQTVNIYTAKYLTYKSNEEVINTRDDKRIEIQMYAQYRVIDPVTFNWSVRTKSEANKRMDEIIYKVVIQSANTLEFNQFFDQSTLENLLEEKQLLLNEELITEYGLYVTDIGINRKNFPASNVDSIEQKMALQIEKESEKLTAEGDSEYIQAQATADREKAEIVATAVETAAIIKAEADAEAIKIYQESLGKDLEFYQFIKRMEIYKEMEDITIFIDGDNDIFNLLNGYKLED